VKAHFINLFTSDLVETTRANLQQAGLTSPEAVRAQPAPLVAFSPSTRHLRDELHAFLMQHMYRHPEVVVMWEKAQRLIGAIFAALYEEPAQLPADRQAHLAGGNDTATVICDYIAEMSDRKLVREYHRLFDYDVQVLP
jgi:dGTPase